MNKLDWVEAGATPGTGRSTLTVLHLISSEGYYGAESMMITLAAALGREGHNPVVGVFADSRRPHIEAAEEAHRRGLVVEKVPCRGRWDWAAVGHARRILKRHGVDVLHTHGYKADLYGYAAAWQRRTALVSTCHNWPDRRPLMRAYAALDRILLRRFNGVAAASEPVAEVLRDWGVAASALPNGVEMARFRDANPALRLEMAPGCRRLAGFVGRLVPGKGGAVLLEAARTVITARPDTAFVFVGDGPCRREWESLAGQLGIARNVIFAGVRNDMANVYASLDMLVLPSFEEALPMTVLEAMAAARPVVATPVGSVPRAVLAGVTGLLVAPGDAAGLARTVLQLLDNPELAVRLGRQARDHVERNFSSETMAAAYLQLYERALAGDGAGRKRVKAS